MIVLIERMERVTVGDPRNPFIVFEVASAAESIRRLDDFVKIQIEPSFREVSAYVHIDSDPDDDFPDPGGDVVGDG